MQHIATFEFIVGVAVGKVLLGALFASSIFRNVALASAAAGVCVIYFQKGVSGLMQFAHLAVADMTLRPDFSKGAALGAVVAFLVFGLYLKRGRV